MSEALLLLSRGRKVVMMETSSSLRWFHWQPVSPGPLGPSIVTLGAWEETLVSIQLNVCFFFALRCLAYTKCIFLFVVLLLDALCTYMLAIVESCSC